MPATEVTTLQIVCDNPACPGNSLDPAVRTGWVFISSEVYGLPSSQNVYCCPDCASAISGAIFTGPPPDGIGIGGGGEELP